MRAALQDAQLNPEDIGYVNAHGTATIEGDPIEVAAIAEVFGTHAKTLPVSATKSSHGHMMGATGAVEASISVLALTQRILLPTASLTTIDPACAGVQHITAHAGHAPSIKAVMSNSFAFGGSNAVLVFKAVA
jgi:3-oxoacyl-[acyl-carrier-protein] synthase II